MRRRRRTRLRIEEVAEAYGLDPSELPDSTETETATRNFAGRHAVRDLAFGHFLVLAHQQGVFSPHRQVIFKGGTALRKTRFGAASRMSQDMDFGGVPKKLERMFWETMSGTRSGPFVFRPYLTNRHRGRLAIESDLFLGGSDLVHLDINNQPPLMPGEARRLEPSPLDDTYRQVAGGWLPVMPVIENAAGKLCRWYNRPLIRDLYDLARLAPELHPRIEELAEVTVCTASARDPLGARPGQRLTTTAYGDAPVFGSLAERLNDWAEDTAPGRGYLLPDLAFIPEIPEQAKKAMVDQCLETVYSLTEALEQAVCSDDRLLRISQEGPDAGELSAELAAEIRSRYSTVRSDAESAGRRAPVAPARTVISPARLSAAVSGSRPCGAATGTTEGPCRNRVQRPGDRCWLHR